MNYTLFSYSSSSPSCYLQLPVIRRTTPFLYPQHYSQWLWNILYIIQLPVVRQTTPPPWYPQHYSHCWWNILYIIQLPDVRQTTPPPCYLQHYSQCWWNTLYIIQLPVVRQTSPPCWYALHYSQCWWNILSYQTWCLGGVLVYRAWLKKIVGQLPLYCNQAVLCCSSWAIGLPFTDWGLWWDLFVLSRGGITPLISILRGPEISNAFTENDTGINNLILLSLTLKKGSAGPPSFFQFFAPV